MPKYSPPLVTRESFMAAFRDDELLATLSPEDRVELFSHALVGASDFTKELLDSVLQDYCVDSLVVIEQAPKAAPPKKGKPLSKVLAAALNRFDTACQGYAFRGSAHKDDAEERTIEYKSARKDLEAAMDFYDDGAEVIKEFSTLIIETAAKFNSLVRKVRDSRGA